MNADGSAQNRVTDSDNDGVGDSKDAFPLDPTATSDKDRDFIPDHLHPDDNNDGLADNAADGTDAYENDNDLSSASLLAVGVADGQPPLDPRHCPSAAGGVGRRRLSGDLDHRVLTGTGRERNSDPSGEVVVDDIVNGDVTFGAGPICAMGPPQRMDRRLIDRQREGEGDQPVAAAGPRRPHVNQ